MNDHSRVYSESGSRILEVVKGEDGLFTLQEFARRYDAEEEITYEIKVESNYSSKFDDFDIALKEAKRLISL